MLEGFIGGLIVAWILNLFNVGSMILEVVQPFVGIELTMTHYYLALALIGLIGGAFRK